MSSNSQHADPAGDAHLIGGTPNQLQLLQRLEALEMQCGLDAQNIAQLREQNKALEDVLIMERAGGEKHAEALMHVARGCDNRVEEIKTQHAAAIMAHQTRIVKLEAAAAAKDVLLLELKAQNAALRIHVAALQAQAQAQAAAAKDNAILDEVKAENAALKLQLSVFQAQAMTKLTDIHTAVAAFHTLLPPQSHSSSAAFDCNWCTAVCGKQWNVDIDAATGMRAHVKQKMNPCCTGCLTLRSAAPLSSRHLNQLPAYRIVVEAHNESQICYLGFVPSHYPGRNGARAAVTPELRFSIEKYGGWYIAVGRAGFLSNGWTALEPSDSGYATTSKIPSVPAGGAVEFAVDYAAGTCRVAFYTPTAVAGGFVTPHAKMELRFVAAAATEIVPARPIPTLPDSGVELYPVAATDFVGPIWRFAS